MRLHFSFLDTATNLRRSVEILEFLKTAKRKRTYEEIEEIDEEIVGEGEEGEEDEDETNNQCNYMKYSEENDEVSTFFSRSKLGLIPTDLFSNKALKFFLNVLKALTVDKVYILRFLNRIF